MSVFEKNRFEIWNAGQHPYKHTLADFSYSNPSLPGVTNVEGAMNWLIAVLYPNSKPAVANVAALPLVGNTLNDYRVVQDDGDGNAAAYRWEQREGEVSASWHKVMDMDWSTDSILAGFTDIAQDLFVHRKGKQDLDGLGAVITGLYAGQTIYGGLLANQNLTLRANAGDGVGPHTGYVQVDDNFRPAVDDLFSLGTATERFSIGYFSDSLNVDTLSISSGLIEDSGGVLSFNTNDVVTLGTITGSDGFFSTSVEVGSFLGDALVLGAGSITDESGQISFGTTNLLNTGSLETGYLYVTKNGYSFEIDADLGDAGTEVGFISPLPLINLQAINLLSTGNLDFTQGTFSSLVSGGNLRLSGNTLDSLDTNGNITLLPNGTGIVDVQKAMQTLGITATGTVGVTGLLNVDNLRLDGNTLSSTDINGNIVLSPNGTGLLSTTSDILPGTDNAKDLGSAALRFAELYLSSLIGDGTNSIAISVLMSLRDINVGVAAGHTIFWDGAKWISSTPDTEVDHGNISGLLDDDHTQYALLAGRASGQTLIGGTAASEDLLLQSTANATRGFVKVADSLAPSTTASYSGGWSGKDLGSSSLYFRNLYTKGELFGARMENLTVATLPSPSAQNVGRFVYATDVNKAYVDTGSSMKVLGVSKFVQDTAWNGSDTTKDVTVSSDITDARLAIWALFDNASDFDRIYCSIKAISATQVRITVSPALPAGSYRLIGIE